MTGSDVRKRSAMLTAPEMATRIASTVSWPASTSLPAAQATSAAVSVRVLIHNVRDFSGLLVGIVMLLVEFAWLGEYLFPAVQAVVPFAAIGTRSRVIEQDAGSASHFGADAVVVRWLQQPVAVRTPFSRELTHVSSPWLTWTGW